MNYKNFFIGMLVIIVPIVLLYMCSINYKNSLKLMKTDTQENFETVIRKKPEKKDLNQMKYFTENKDGNEPKMIATNPVHMQTKNIPSNIPIQIESFQPGNWENLKYFHPKNIGLNEENPPLVATNPIHKKGDVVEGFLGNFKDKVSNLFSKPNSKMDIDLKNHNIPSLKKDNYSNDLDKLKKAQEELSKLEDQHITKQFNNNLKSTNQNLNKKIASRTLGNSNKGLPIINARPQSNVPIQPKKPSFDIKSLDCQFFSDSCPAGYHENGFFSVGGTTSDGLTLTCGNASSTKNAEAIAQIRDEKLVGIKITDSGSGYLPNNAPKVEIISREGRGNGATAEAVVDDNGLVKLIKITNQGNNYTETPEIKLSHPNMNRSCHFCCKIK